MIAFYILSAACAECISPQANCWMQESRCALIEHFLSVCNSLLGWRHEDLYAMLYYIYHLCSHLLTCDANLQYGIDNTTRLRDCCEENNLFVNPMTASVSRASESRSERNCLLCG